MSFRIIRAGELEWITRPHEPGEPARHVAELVSSPALRTRARSSGATSPVRRVAFTGTRSRRRHSSFTLVRSMYLGDPPERHDVPPGGLVQVDPGTPLQTVNHGDEDLLVYAYGTPPESEHAEILESAL